VPGLIIILLLLLGVIHISPSGSSPSATGRTAPRWSFGAGCGRVRPNASIGTRDRPEIEERAGAGGSPADRTSKPHHP
jgi:hypothetical protein